MSSAPDRAENPSPLFMPALHGLRGIAALGVLLFHWSHYFPEANRQIAQWHVGHPWINPTLPCALGYQGVFLFFVLSGFLLARVLQREPTLSRAVYSQYLARRVLRIYPAVWLQIAVLASVPLVWAAWPADLAQRPLWPQLLLWVNLPPDFHAPINGVWWTLPVELMFYALLPALLWFMRRFGWPMLWAVAVLFTVGWRVGVMALMDVPEFSASVHRLDTTAGVLSTFVAGVCASQWAASASANRWAKHWTLSGLAGMLACEFLLISNIETYWQRGWLLVLWNTLFSGGLALLVAGVVAGAQARWLGSPVMQWLGERSFGLYLWHVPVMQGMLLFDAALAGQATSVFWVLLLTSVLAEISYRSVERPAMRWARRLSNR